MITYPLATGRAQLVVDIAVGGTFHGLKVGAYKNALVPGPNTTIDDLVECDFTGYSRSGVITFGTPHNGPTGQAETVGGEASFVATGSSVSNDVQGWFLVLEGTPDVLIAAESFDSPISVARAGDGFAVVPVIRSVMAGVGLVA